ncbi:zeta-carotene desaturase, chloroplastic/chromoplastic-like [Magnolia sinica]|uniref:zeta-carotene desaturase, chloroplastic/chromoplastic-like n=1 Tax=Magnolia sinica TaxID=86752 RepID=UPI00265941F3|nr:zeta-carotene desaturase, chloroplastic/chromoplastic-like [Magnolia sinica]
MEKLNLVNSVLFTGGWAKTGLYYETVQEIFKVHIYDSRSFIGGKVGSFVDKGENHIEMGLHVFFGCYRNLFHLMKKVKSPSFVIRLIISRRRNVNHLQ